MIRRPPRSTLDRSSAASDVYKRQSDDISVCSGESATLSASGGTSYVWSPATYLDDAFSANPICTALTDISYTVTSINADGCSDEDIINVIVAVGDFATASPETTICVGTSTDLFASGGTSYSCLLYTSPSPRDRTRSRMPSSA